MEKGKQMRFSDDELALIKSTFKSNDRLLKILRKVFLPEIDPTAPFGQTIDLWMTLDIRNMMPEQAYANLIARNSVITHVDQQLMQLEFLANMTEETEKEKAERHKKDSTK